MCVATYLILFNYERCLRTEFITLPRGSRFKTWRKTVQGENKRRADSHIILSRVFALVAFIWKFSLKVNSLFEGWIMHIAFTANSAVRLFV